MIGKTQISLKMDNFNPTTKDWYYFLGNNSVYQLLTSTKSTLINIIYSK